jgi:ATP-binding cassette, subfamily C, bacteriocin exporter
MKKNIHHIQQQGQSDCGVACLKAILQHYDSDASFERLRELSGTTTQGTTMLGIVQAGQQLGLDTEGFEADMDNLKTCEDITILHVILNETMQHYITCYRYDAAKDAFLIGDPSRNTVEWLSPEDLDKIWVSKTLLLLKPTDKLVKTASKKSENRAWLKEYFAPDFNILGIALVLGFCIAALGIATALFSQKLIDQILPSKDTLKLYSGVGLLCALLFFRTFIGYLREIFLLRQSYDFNLRIIDYFYGSLMYLPKSFFDTRKTGELITRLNDTSRIQQTVSLIVGSVAIDALMVVIALVTIFNFDWQIGLIVSVWIPLYVLLLARFQPKIITGQRDIMAAYAQNESHYVDTIQGVGDIKIANRESFFKQITQVVYGFYQQKILDLGKITRRYGMLNEMLGTVFIIAVILLSSLFVLRGQLTVGSVMALIQMVGMLMGSASSLGAANIRLQEAKVAFERMYEFTSIKSEYDENDTAKSTITDFQELKVDNMAFRFAGRKRLLQDVSFYVQKGEMIALIGESGSGKSTALQILQKFYAPEEGKVKVNGVDFDLISTKAWRSIIGVVPQDIKLFNGSLIDNILLGDTVDNLQTLVDFFEKHGFNRFFEQFPNGYATILGENGVNISGGQMQLVGLARALWKKPQLLLLDEPTSALDRDTEKFVIELLKNIQKDIGIVLLTHRISIARDAHKIYILEQGVTSKEGSHQQLLKTDNLYSRAWSDAIAA